MHFVEEGKKKEKEKEKKKLDYLIVCLCFFFTLYSVLPNVGNRSSKVLLYTIMKIFREIL